MSTPTSKVFACLLIKSMISFPCIMKISISEHFTYKKLLRFVFPSITMIILTSVYCVVDGYFISNYVGKTAFAAVNLAWPYIMILGGLGFMMGVGGTALVSKTEGEGDKQRADKYFSMTVIFTAALSILATIVGVPLIRPISQLLGAKGELLDGCATYGGVFISFMTFFMLQNVFQVFLTAAERPMLGLMVTVAAGATNVVLDALFVAVLQLGLEGAALASGLGQAVGTIIPLIYFICPNTSLLQLKLCRLEFKPLLKMITNGSSELMTNIASSIVGILYNNQLLASFGENGVDAFGVLMYVQFIFVGLEIGYSVGSSPIIAYHYGAENKDELKNLFKKSIFLMSTSGVILTIAAQAFAIPVAQIFVGYDGELKELTVHAFRIFSFALVFSGINIFSSGFFTALNNGAVSAILSFLRTLILQSVFVLSIPVIFGVDGIWWATLCTEAVAAIIAVSFFIAYRKKYGYA